MGLVKIILIYFGLNFGLRFIIDLGIFFLIKITCSLIESIDNKFKKYIIYIIEHKIETEVENLSTIKDLNIKNIFKLIIKGINYLISEKYSTPSKLEGSLIIKFKCNINKCLDKLYDRKYQLPFHNEEMLKHYGMAVFNICIFNILLMGMIYYYFIDGNKVIAILEFIKRFEYTKFLNYIVFILLLPIIKAIWNYTKLKLLLKNECSELESKYIRLFRFIQENIEEINIYKIDNEIECIADEITNNVGFKFYGGKLKIHNRSNIYIYDKKEKRLHLECISGEINKINNFIRDKFIKNNGERYIFEQWFLRISYSSEIYEKNILDYKSNGDYKEFSKYFKKNHNQIYKSKIANVRVIKEDQIVFLDSEIEKCGNWLENYRNEFIKYILSILILSYKVKKHLIYMNRTVFSTNLENILKTIIGMSIREYFKLIKKIIY
ncbi:hypothetical protein [Clostridium sp. ZBS14]|uniref:hypothetical protein n=1 Tax=Clostridium sp. ZBS14 TaxID=2949970 RepID=UPI00207962FE|nr:hypothetical protein [Clostridium sp. ZBS14]